MTLHIGIIGCGQLGQMLGLATLRLNLKASFLSLGETPLVEGLGTIYTADDFDSFLDTCDYVTVEREAVPLELLRKAELAGKLRPSLKALQQLRDRSLQKACLDELGIATSPWTAADSASELEKKFHDLGTPYARCKRSVGGYDGLGQWRLTTAAIPEIPDDCYPLIIEQEVKVDAEMSLLIARDGQGRVVCYPPVENTMQNGVLLWSYAPAPLDEELVLQMQDYAARLAHSVDYIGVLAVEYFVSAGRLLVNEVAPRVHNTGHWTTEASSCDQFQQHIRAVAGLELIAPVQCGAVAMANVLGESPPAALSFEGARSYLHMYGKAARQGRKLGHITLVAPTLEQARAAAQSWIAQR